MGSEILLRIGLVANFRQELGPFIRAQDKLRKAGDSLSAVEILYFEHFGTTAAKISPYETEVKALLQAEVEG